MLKGLAEGNYRANIPEGPQLYTTRQSYYKLSTKKRDKSRFEMSALQWTFNSEYKSAPLLNKFTEVCLCAAEVPILTDIDSYYFASFPYLFTMEEAPIDDEHPKQSDWYMRLSLHSIEHTLVSEAQIVPFSPKPVPNFGQVADTRVHHMIDKRKSPCFQNGFPKNAKIAQAGNDLFLVFGGQAAEDRVSELSLIAMTKRNEVTLTGIYSPLIVGLLPHPRDKFALCSVSNAVFLFGGENEGQLFGDLWKFETSPLSSNEGDYSVLCTQVITGDVAIPRTNALITAIGRDLYVLGGKSSSGFEVPVSKLSLETLIWSEKTYIGQKIFTGDENISILPSKDPFLIVARVTTHRSHYNCKKRVDLWLLDTDLSRSSQIENVPDSALFLALPNDYYFTDQHSIYKMLFSAHYRCRRVAQPVPSLHRLLGAVLDAELFSDVEVEFASGTVKLLQSCLAVRGSEAAGLLRAVQQPEVLVKHYSYAVLRTMVRYLYTDTVVVPPLPVKSHKGSELLTTSDFLEEVQESAAALQMTNLRNLCVISLTQACSLDSSKVDLYADYRRLATIPIEPDLEFTRESSTEAAFAYLLAPDYKLVCLDGTVGAHKFVLFTRSSLFRRVFAGGFDLDQEEFKVDFDCNTVQQAKRFMYTDQADLQSHQIVETMRIAAFLGIPDLFQLCQLHAARDINYANLMATFDLALQLNAVELIQYCEDLYENCHLGGLKEYQDFLAENPELGNHFAQFRANRYYSKEKFGTLSEADQNEALSSFLSTAPLPASPVPTSYFDPLPGFLRDIAEIQSSGKSNLCLPPPLHLSKQVSLEDEHWECSNRFVLSSSESEEETQQ